METNVDFSALPLNDLIQSGEFQCSCGKIHRSELKNLDITEGAVRKLPEILSGAGIWKPYLIADLSTYEAGGKKVSDTLRAAGFAPIEYIFQSERPESDEKSVGLAAMAYDTACDGVLAVGSGSIGDISKIIARVGRIPMVTVATAPSMDGFASPTCSNVVNGLKSTVPGVCPIAILGDLDILRNAPARMLQAGLGDMAAKSIAVLEWKIAHLITGEYYCDRVASLMLKSAQKCLSSASGLMRRDPRAVANIMEGLVMSGTAIGFAGVTRPASGIEHYFSHVWDMLALQKKEMPDLHGIQVGVGTVYAAKIYDRIKQIKPDRKKALDAMRHFNLVQWKASIVAFFPSAAGSIIRQAAAESRFDRESHAERVGRIIDRWDDILRIIRADAPDPEVVAQQLHVAGAPVTAAEIGIDSRTLKQTFLRTKDLRNKYMAGSLLWDLGMLNEIADDLF